MYGVCICMYGVCICIVWYVWLYVYVCMVVCMSVCLYVCMPVCIYVCMYVCICMYMYVYVYVCMCMYVYVYVCVCMCMYVYVCVCMCMYVCICMYDIRGPHKKMERIFLDVTDSNFSLVSLSAGHHNEDALAKGTRLVSIRSLADGHVVTSLMGLGKSSPNGLISVVRY